MEETITFWLDNKICSGFKIAVIGSQTLVSYRDKYYVVVGGAAQMKGVRPLHYSKTSMPLLWKKALKGILPAPVASMEHTEDDYLPLTTSIKKERKTMQKSTSPLSDPAEDQPQLVKPAVKKPAAAEIKPHKIVPSNIPATCPYCNQKQELPFEKGKNGKPFFVTCVKCNVDFAVRFVPVTVYQAQVAAFK